MGIKRREGGEGLVVVAVVVAAAAVVVVLVDPIPVAVEAVEAVVEAVDPPLAAVGVTAVHDAETINEGGVIALVVVRHRDRRDRRVEMRIGGGGSRHVDHILRIWGERGRGVSLLDRIVLDGRMLDEDRVVCCIAVLIALKLHEKMILVIGSFYTFEEFLRP